MKNENLEMGQTAEGIVHLIFNRIMITFSALIILCTVFHYSLRLVMRFYLYDCCLSLLELYHTWTAL